MASSIFTKLSTALKYSVLGYCSMHCISEYLLDFTWCSGPSMQPTISQDDILLTEHIGIYFFQNIHRGDIVILRSPYDPTKLMCKRVIKIAYDEIPTSSSMDIQFVPKGHVWLEGDNKKNSTDSKVLGPIPVGLLKSRAIFRVWPKDRIGLI